MESAEELYGLVGMNLLYQGGEEPVCIFEMDCRIPAEGTQYQVYNTVADGSLAQCNGGWYTFEKAEEELKVSFHQDQDSEPMFSYALQKAD